MRMMLILFAVSAFVYFLTGINGRFSKRTRLYIAIGAFLVTYLGTMIAVLFGGTS